MVVDCTPGIVKAYEAVTQYCGFHAIEAGKTMGLFPYGKPNEKIPLSFQRKQNWWIYSNQFEHAFPNISKCVSS